MYIIFQRTETGNNSGAMEKAAFIQGVEELKFLMPIKHLVTDRHPGINKYMTKDQPDPIVPLYYDCWHVVKGMNNRYYFSCLKLHVILIWFTSGAKRNTSFL